MTNHNWAKIIDIDPVRQTERETVVSTADRNVGIREALRAKLGRDYEPMQELRSHLQRYAYERNMDVSSLTEAFVASPDAANMLRDGIRFLSFLSYAEMASTYDAFTTVQSSSKPQEEYLRDSIMGTIPQTPSGAPVPFVRSGFEGGVIIKNYRYAAGVEVTGDDIRFDRLGKIAQIAAELGRSGRMTEESKVYADITTTANYTRNSTTNDNDVGANTQTLTFSAIGFETGMSIVSTSKDKNSGAYLGLMPDTLITTPKMEWAVKQLLLSELIVRASANNTAETRGTGTTSPYRGAINRIIISPWFGAGFQWALVDTRRMSYVKQNVESWNILQEGMNASSEAWLIKNSIRYVIEGYFGTGFVDDRPWFYSDSTTTPAIS